MKCTCGWVWKLQNAQKWHNRKMFPPPPGYSAILLGLLGIVMSLTLSKEPTKRERSFWIVVSRILMAVEMWAITHDRNTQDSKYEEEARKRQSQFEATVAQLQSIDIHVVQIPTSLSTMEIRLDAEIAKSKHGAAKPEPTLKERALVTAKDITDFLTIRSDEASWLGG